MNNKNKQSVLPEGFVPPHSISGMPPESAVLVGFSGGADSRALLDLLVRYAADSGCRIYAAHVNHCIRGEEADRDEEFCRKVAESYGIQIFVHRIDIPSLAKESGKSVELCARDERYAFFSKIMRENGIPLLATAHNANDNLETILFNLTRGTGLSGLCGIPPRRECDSGMLIRPILEMSKDDILLYCRERGLDFVTDSTNVDTDYTRNKIRAEAVPVLKEISAAAEKRATTTSKLLRRDAELLSSLTDELIDKAIDKDDSLELSQIVSAHPSISSRAIMRLFSRLSDTSLEEIHVDDVLKLCKAAKNGSRISLPDGICALIREGRLYLLHDIDVTTNTPPCFEAAVCEGENPISQINAEIVIGKSQREINIYKKSIQFTIDSATINGTLTLRERRAGDRIFMGGMHKSVKKLMCDKKISTDIRYRIPMICDGDGIVAIPFVGVRDSSDTKKNKTESKNILSIQFYLY